MKLARVAEPFHLQFEEAFAKQSLGCFLCLRDCFDLQYVNIKRSASAILDF